jgi:hypothetical protein
MIVFPMFWKKYGTRNLGNLTQVHSIADLAELPTQSILHILDNFPKDDNLLVIPDTKGELFALQPERKIVAHNLAPKVRETDIYTEVDDMIKPPIGSIILLLQKFRAANSRLIRFIPDVDQIIPRNGFQAIINHNNLFRSRVFGINRKARLFEHILGNIINTIAHYPQYKHFIQIPLSDALFNRSSFERAFKVISRTTLKYPNSMHYICMTHFLSLINSKSDSSMFNKIPHELLSNIIFTFTHRQQVVFYDATVLKAMNGDSNAILLKLIANFNMLASGGATISEDVPDAVPVNQTVTPAEEKPVTKAEEKEIALKLTTITEVAEPEKVDSLKIEGPTVPEKVIEHRLDEATGKNVATYTVTTPDLKQQEKQLQQDVDDLDTLATQQAETIQDSTPAKRERVRRLAVAYKQLKFAPEGKTLDELITTPMPPSVDDHKIEVLDGQIPDQSMLTSKIVNFNQDYLATMFESDLAKTLVSFNQHGLFLTDVSFKDEIDELNRIRHYTAKYEDTSHQPHTIRFSLPIIDPHGNCWINGTQKFFKKQRANNPIVKSSPSRVSLATNYNKVLVERVAAVANSFYPYMSTIFRKTKIELTHGVSQDELSWKFLSIPDTTTNRKRYIDGKELTALVGGPTAEEWLAFEGMYVRSTMGPMRITSKEKITSAKDYPGTAEERDAVDKLSPLCSIVALPVVIPRSLPYEYTVLGTKIKYALKDKLRLCFHYEDRLNDLTAKQLQQITTMESTYGVYIGTTDGTNFCFMTVQGELIVRSKLVDGDTTYTTLIDEICRITGLKPNPLADYAILKILNTVLPIGMVMTYRFGLKYILNYLKVKYKIIEGEELRTRASTKDIPASSVVIVFKDAKLVIPRTPAVPSMILAGLDKFDLREFSITEMETKDVYYSLMEQLKLSTNYLKGVDSFFDLFLDPITIDVLRQMGEPTNVLDLLIRAVALLRTEDFEPSSSTKNSRIRSYERFSGILYNEIAQAVATHKYRALGAKASISINPLTVYKRILTDSLMENMNTINPLHDIKMQTLLSHLGDGGRTEQTFMINDRKFTEDSIGVISEATVDSGNVAVIVSSSMDPQLENLRGQSAGVAADKVEPTQLLSLTSLLFPGATYDDQYGLVRW